jgi:M6 family metalloprotease-like protein
MSMRSVNSMLVITASLLLFGSFDQSLATEPPADTAEFPSGALANRLQKFTVKRGFLNLTRTVFANRAALSSGVLSFAEVSAKGGVAITGKKAIPVIMLKYSDTSTNPYPVANLQKELFDGPWPSGTMGDFYKEISYGQFTVTGTVYPWYTAKNKGGYYQGIITTGPGGPKPCNGICPSNHLGELLKETLDAVNKNIDFSIYDNDGPDGTPNSGDDDGYVDFVAFVHPGKGGECGSRNGEINNNIWSHRFRLSDLTGRDYETKNFDKEGRRIRIDDYVIMPALDCDGKSMIEIGVFAHEFGHAFELPDLYDTQQTPVSQGVGNWDLMGAGSWGETTKAHIGQLICLSGRRNFLAGLRQRLYLPIPMA